MVCDCVFVLLFMVVFGVFCGVLFVCVELWGLFEWLVLWMLCVCFLVIVWVGFGGWCCFFFSR